MQEKFNDNLPPERRKLNIMKVIVIGESGVGKTSLLNMYTVQRMRPYKSTLGGDFFTKELLINNQPCLLQIWDTAGSFSKVSSYLNF